jgi:general secretion pathway protein I
LIRRRQRGFTLLEVIVALTVLAITLGSIIKATGDYTANQAYLRDRTLANWVARNVLAEFQLDSAWPEVGERKGTVEMGRMEWDWLARISQTEEADLRRLDVEVRPLDADDTDPLVILSGFLWKP